jgi:hypothetical protein
MKKKILFFLGFILLANCSFAQDLVLDEVETQALVTPQNIDFSRGTKIFDFPVEKLFYMSILALNANNFEIEELQSKMGYILFKGANKTFLMSVVKVTPEKSMLKITPADNVYYFPYGVVYNIYKYIDLNADEQLKILEVTGNKPQVQLVMPNPVE